jgi:CHAD domain-containing protein
MQTEIIATHNGSNPPGTSHDSLESRVETGQSSARDEVASDEATEMVAPALTSKLRCSIDQSLELLANVHPDLDHAVHAVRKSNKTVMATFWLLAPWVPPESLDRARSLVRESSRLLQRQRRAVALLAALEQLEASEEPNAAGVLAQHLAAERQLEGDTDDRARRHLRDALDEVATWPGGTVLDREVLSRFRKMRRRTRRMTRAARRKASPERLHDLRKQVKRHRALGEALSPFIKQRKDGKRLDALADRLGNVNDLEDLRVEVQQAEPTGSTGELQRLEKRVRRRQRKEIRGSLKLARKLLKKR